ncbi:PREDICTED: interleukin-31 receptor subunit alpha [Miniopterus natalensis]|uniref:interleukin-31 receptor subunit alpha n=1 Tax=Miniopterus natalensis TaxID=291302 RepID=UPI0007A7126D|nr:PREDICTED: interleukin-31 receptor subunit alpha [Miniopterus natalensis]
MEGPVLPGGMMLRWAEATAPRGPPSATSSQSSRTTDLFPEALVVTMGAACANLGTMRAWALWLLPLLCELGLAVLPAKPENISCILYYKKNFTCTWSPEKEASYTRYTVRRTHNYGSENDTCNSTSENRASCSFLPPAITLPDNYTIQVEARNAHGTVESDVTQWHLDTIVKVEPPMIFSVIPVLGVKRMLQIKWKRPELAPVSQALKCTLRFRTVNSVRWMEVNFTEGIYGDQTYNLTGLQAFAEYVVTLRCAAEESRFWSGWSQAKRGTTEEEAPLGLDLWRVLGPAREDGRRPVTLLWKKARGAPVLERTLGYHIWYFPENTTNLTETANTTHQQLELVLGGEAYWVSVVSYNSLGQCPAATLRIPAASEKAFPCIEAMQAQLSGDQLVVAWQSSALDTDAWMVEWFPDLDFEPATLCWESVFGARNWTIRQDKLTPFWCYNISVYPVLQDRVCEPYSVQAYAKEGVPSAGPVTKAENIGVKAVTITWKEIPKNQRNGFIRNYTIFYQAENGEEFSTTVNSSLLQYSLESLTRKTSYTVQVMASTSAGGTNGTRISFKTLSISVLEICLVAALVGGGLLIFTVLTVGYSLRKPNKLKHLCWPDVPNPAESSIATWHGGDLKDKGKEADDPASTEDERILKPWPAPSDLIDKLVVNFENFLEEVSAEEPGKGQEQAPGGERNEYVAAPYCAPVQRPVEPPTAAEAPPTATETEVTGLGSAKLLIHKGDLVTPREDLAVHGREKTRLE